jgi:alpha/beta superfamily hydrolase
VVLAGQYLERPALIPCGELTLEGLSHRGARRPALLVCPPTGPGGGMDSPLVAELAWASARAGHASLRFQHRGVGGSQGAPDPAAESEDAAAAFDHLAAGGHGAIVVVGVGRGCATAAALAAVRPSAGLVLLAPLAPPTSGPAALEVLVVLPEVGSAVAPGDLPAGVRVEVVAGADPFFRSGLPQVGKAVMAWAAGRR